MKTTAVAEHGRERGGGQGGTGGGGGRMARSGVECWRAAKWWSYKRTTVVVCCVNLAAALYALRSLSTSLNIFSSPPTTSSSSSSGSINHSSDFKYTEDQIKKIKESIQIRRNLEPVELVRLVRELSKEFSGEGRRLKLSRLMKQMLTNEILQMLNGVEDVTNVTENREAVEVWRVEKLKAVRRVKLSNSTSNSSISAEEAKMLERALESDWLMLSEEIGLWMPADVINKEINDKPENVQELEEEEIVAGPPLPPECNAEPHTDYDGAAVRWGLTHHKESAADCCQACLDQAKRAKAGEMKCNIWVYCPSEPGCFSPDIYEHQHQECWLKQADKPRLSFKDMYSETYRSSHPTAPVVVPWMSGVVST